MGKYTLIVIIILVLILALAAVGIVYAIGELLKGSDKEPRWTPESPEKRAGRRGEIAAADAIRQVLREDDFLLSNLHITIPEKETELDNVVVNKYGVFIIEVKSYKGRLVGAEDDYEWQKYKTTAAGNVYEKTVKNPIVQVKRQVYILARYLRYYGVDVWVKGYAILLEGNSPVDSEYVLRSLGDIDRAIHTFDRARLDKKTVEKIVELLK